MHILGLGTAIIECLRVRRLLERHGEAFLQRAFSDAEVRYCQSRRHPNEQFAAWWAAKEAVLKALGQPLSSGGRGRGAGLVEVELRPGKDGRPRVLLRGSVRERARSLRLARLLLSTAHCRSSAAATALAFRADLKSDSPADT